MDKVAILGFGRKFQNEPRIRNEILALKYHYEIDGYGNSSVEGINKFYTINQPNKLLYRIIKILGSFFPDIRIKFELLWYKNITRLIKKNNYKYIIVHNILDALAAIDGKTPVIFHSHEYLPREFDGSFIFRLTEMRYREKALKITLNYSSSIVVEGDSVASEYSKNFMLNKSKFLIVASKPEFRKKTNRISITKPIRLIHHGLLDPERGIELFIEIARQLGNNYQVTIMGPGSKEYILKLKNLSADLKNFFIKPPVKYEEIVETISNHHLGLVIFNSPHYHHKYMTVPNKFWECLQARLPVLVSSDSAMSEYVMNENCGIVSDGDDLESYVDAIRNTSITEINKMKMNCENKSKAHSRDSWIHSFREKIENNLISKL